MEKLNNIPAFPSTVETTCYGMSLRDYFAAQAIPTVTADLLESQGRTAGLNLSEAIARDCYLVADAMLKAREA